MSLRLLVVGIEFAGGIVFLVWGIASTWRPSLWRWRGAHWWVDQTRKKVSRAHGVGIALVAIAVAVSAPAPLLPPPITSGAIDAQALEVIGLIVASLGAILMVASHPTALQAPEPREYDSPQESLATRPDGVPGAPVLDDVPALAASPTA